MSAEPFKADLRPVKAWQETESVELIARTSHDKVLVKTPTRTFSADRFRLFTPRQPGKVPVPIEARDLDRLPWQGKGPDPVEPFREAFV